MDFDYMRIPAIDAERLCYAEGFENAAKLFARIEALQHALGVATAENETMREALEELVAEADRPVNWSGHESSNTYGFQLARKALAIVRRAT
jgi:hypothetical protein